VLLNWRVEVDHPLDPDEALPQLEYLAYAMCDQGVQRLRRDEVIGLLETVRRDYPYIRPIHREPPSEFLAQLERRTGLLVAVGEAEHAGRPIPVYEFRHLTFQEYLAARAILEGHFPGHRTGTSLAQRITSLAGTVTMHFSGEGWEALINESWQEALRLCVASCNDDDVDPLLDAILQLEHPGEASARAIQALLCLADEPDASPYQANEVLCRFADSVDKTWPQSGGSRAVIEAARSAWARPTDLLENSRCGISQARSPT
jgi:hypothetical protein